MVSAPLAEVVAEHDMGQLMQDKSKQLIGVQLINELGIEHDLTAIGPRGPFVHLHIPREAEAYSCPKGFLKEEALHDNSLNATFAFGN